MVVRQVGLLRESFVAVTVIVCAHGATGIPATGDCLVETSSVPLQLSLAVTPPNTFGTAAWQPASALALVGAGQLTRSADRRVAEDDAVQVALLPASSTAVTVIVCAPSPTNVPATGD